METWETRAEARDKKIRSRKQKPRSNRKNLELLLSSIRKSISGRSKRKKSKTPASS